MNKHPIPLATAMLLALNLTGCGTTGGGTGATQAPQLEVGVRASVPDKTHLWSHDKNKVPGDGGHGKVYGILAVKQIESDFRLVKPVDEGYVASQLLRVLDANGFREFKRGEKPQILITASYGRGELANPYIRDTGEVGGSANSGPAPQGEYGAKDSMDADALAGALLPKNAQGVRSNENSPPSQTITGADPLQLFDDKSPGHEQLLQKASFEKLFIRITAWEYPVGDDPEPKMLWKTIVVVDDPEHRDLNEVAAAMLEAAAPYFDKQPRDREVIAFKPLPNGRVDVGTPEVVTPSRAKTKS